MTMGSLCLAGGLAAAGGIGVVSLVVAALIAGGTFLYNGLTKEVPGAGALNMAALRALNLLLGMSVFGQTAEWVLDRHAGLAGLSWYLVLHGAYIFFLTSLSAREPGPSSQGRDELRSTTRSWLAGTPAWLASALWCVLAGFVPIVVVALARDRHGSMLAGAAASTFWMSYGLKRIRRHGARGIPRLIKLGVQGVIVLDGLLVYAAGADPLGALVVLALLIPSGILASSFPGS